MRSAVKAFLLLAGLCLVLLAAGAVVVSRKAIAPAPPEAKLEVRGEAPWFSRASHGVNHVFLEGNAFERGTRLGRATKALLLRQEEALMARFEEVFPSALARQALLLLARAWFYGIDSELKEEWRREMHGVSLSAPAKYASVADAYTRQLAYHGLHEAGQAFVDYGEEGFGCTVLAVPRASGHWLVGRNFDFEGGRIFDEEKVLKWVYPERGLPFVSVTWAGMVGAVTGVNAKGVYVSLNAAGSQDFARLGTPTTLVLLEALQTGATAEEAVEVIRSAPTVITEIFVVTAPGAPFYVVEKSPRRVFVREERGPVAVANHLVDPAWEADRINAYRRDELTSAARYQRARELVTSLGSRKSVSAADVAAVLRDKQAGGRPQLGHRSAIDALIATHAVVYDSSRGRLWVSLGPSLSGKFRGFDIRSSLAQRRPVPAGELAADSAVAPSVYHRVREDIAAYAAVLNRRQAAGDGCARELAGVEGRATPHYLRSFARALLEEKCGSKERAASLWEEGLALSPAYARERKLAERALSALR